MFDLEVRTHIHRAAADIYAFMSEFSNDAKWQADLVHSEKTSEGPIGVGTTGLYVQKFLGQEMKNEAVVTIYEPPKRFGAKTTSGPVKFEYIITFVEAGGGTDLTMNMKAEAGGFFKLAEGLVKKEAEKVLNRDLAKLKQLLES
jgi:hypothetical protein